MTDNTPDPELPDLSFLEDVKVETLSFRDSILATEHRMDAMAAVQESDVRDAYGEAARIADAGGLHALFPEFPLDYSEVILEGASLAHQSIELIKANTQVPPEMIIASLFAQGVSYGMMHAKRCSEAE